jgi:sterol desaturase/sphingolipid hydroxylase (fatty acid hydroxylase superfamily)
VRVDYIVLAIPVFFVLIGVELLVARIQEKDYYRLNDSISDLSCGVLDQLLEVFLKTALFAGYLFVHDRLRLATLPSSSAVVWAACFLGVDFFYYWFHRMSHEVNAFWAAHVVHHQSEDFNLAVALRQSALQSGFSWVFYLPLALAGFPPLVFLACSSFNTLYQFWIHTRAIGRLGPLEWVLNTPSNHRVHHGRNPKYIDRNHGGTLIVWDRLFGTYAREEEEPAYGITTPLRSWNPVWANLHYWVELFGKARRARRLKDRVRFFLARPGWQPEDMGGFVAAPELDAASLRKFDTPTPARLGGYVLAQFALVLAGTTALLFAGQGLPAAARAAAAVFVALSLVSLSALLELKPWAYGLESSRLALAVAAALMLGAGGGRFLAAAAAAVAVGAALQRWLASSCHPTDAFASAAAPETRSG